MKTDQEAFEWMRSVVAALPNTSEGTHYGEIVFKVKTAKGIEVFASCGDKRGPRHIIFRVNPALTEQLLARKAGFKRYPYEKGVLTIKASDVDNWDEMRAFVAESYRGAAGSEVMNEPASARSPRASPSRRSRR